MSKLLKEDDEYLYLQQYVHYDSDEYSEWMCSPDGRECPDPKWDERLIDAAETACYEISVRYRVRKSDYTVIYDQIAP